MVWKIIWRSTRLLGSTLTCWTYFNTLQVGFSVNLSPVNVHFMVPKFMFIKANKIDNMPSFAHLKARLEDRASYTQVLDGKKKK